MKIPISIFFYKNLRYVKKKILENKLNNHFYLKIKFLIIFLFLI